MADIKHGDPIGVPKYFAGLTWAPCLYIILEEDEIMRLEVWCDNETGKLIVIFEKKPHFTGYGLWWPAHDNITFTDAGKFLKMFTFIGYL